MKESPKVLTEGFHSSITHSFVAVFRDADTYAELIKLDANLPKLDDEFFKSSIAIAAFLGERNTGGFSVDIARDSNGAIRISEKKPGKGMMVPQMITSPFKIVAVKSSASSPVVLSLDEAWKQNLKEYRVKSGTFTMSGGFVAVSEKF